MYLESFKELIVWQKGIELVRDVYTITRKFPHEELYGLTSQMRRAAISIPSNMAEGKKRRTKKDFSQFLYIANGSAAELETQFIIAKQLYPETKLEHSEQLLCEIQKMLSTIIKRLE